MEFNPDNWPEERSTVKSVELHEDGGFSVTQDNRWTFMVRAEEARDKPVPSEGDEVITLGGIGFSIRGIFINGVQYRYQTREEADQEREDWLNNYRREKEERFYANISDWIRRKNLLEEPFRKRLDRFANKGFKEFWVEDGAYELFAVEQANLLYHFAPTHDRAGWLKSFYDATWEEQKEMFPALDDGHSGNTFGAMVGLARAVAEGRDI